MPGVTCFALLAPRFPLSLLFDCFYSVQLCIYDVTGNGGVIAMAPRVDDGQRVRDQ